MTGLLLLPAFFTAACDNCGTCCPRALRRGIGFGVFGDPPVRVAGVRVPARTAETVRASNASLPRPAVLKPGDPSQAFTVSRCRLQLFHAHNMLRMHKWTLRTRVIAQIHGDVVITCIKKLTWPTAYFNSSSLAEQPKVILHGILFTYAVLKVCMSSFKKK